MTPQHRRQVFAMQRQPRGKVMMTSVHDQFMSACVQRNEARFRELVNRVRLIGSRETVNQTDAHGRTPLSHLCGHGSHRCVEDFARLKLVNVNLGDKEGNTPLHYAAQAGHAEVVEILLSRFEGIEVDVRNKLGITPLIKACVTGKRKCVQLLLDKGADPLARDPRRGLTAAQWAHLCAWPDCARLLEARALLGDAGGGSEPVPSSAAAPHSVIVRRVTHGSNPDFAPGPGPDPDPDPSPDYWSDIVKSSGFASDCVNSFIQDLPQDSHSGSNISLNFIVDPDLYLSPNCRTEPSFEPIVDPVPDSESNPSCESRPSQVLRWYSESDLTQESSWLRERHTALTGGGGLCRRASLPNKPDIYWPVDPATWRTESEVPAIRVLEVEAPVDPVVVQYGDPVPPDQHAVQQNQVATLCLPGMGKDFAYE